MKDDLVADVETAVRRFGDGQRETARMLERESRGMVLNADPIPFIPSVGVVRTTELGTMGSRCLGAGSAAALAASAEARAADALVRLETARSRRRSREDMLDARLARLGIGAARPTLERARGFTIVDRPLT